MNVHLKWAGQMEKIEYGTSLAEETVEFQGEGTA
jgi:hypothetical protein